MADLEEDWSDEQESEDEGSYQEMDKYDHGPNTDKTEEMEGTQSLLLMKAQKADHNFLLGNLKWEPQDVKGHMFIKILYSNI